MVSEVTRNEVDALLRAGEKPASIAKQTGVSYQYVAVRRHRLRRAQAEGALSTLRTIAKHAPSMQLAEALALVGKEVSDGE